MSKKDKLSEKLASASNALDMASCIARMQGRLSLALELEDMRKRIRDKVDKKTGILK